jgi:hypothetical protein
MFFLLITLLKRTAAASLIRNILIFMIIIGLTKPSKSFSNFIFTRSHSLTHWRSWLVLWSFPSFITFIFLAIELFQRLWLSKNWRTYSFKQWSNLIRSKCWRLIFSGYFGVRIDYFLFIRLKFVLVEAFRQFCVVFLEKLLSWNINANSHRSNILSILRWLLLLFFALVLL